MLDFLAICVLLLILFTILLFYLTREQSYEQALEEQRNKNDDLLTPTNIIAGDNVDKGGNRKDRTKRLNLNKKSNNLDSKLIQILLPLFDTLTMNVVHLVLIPVLFDQIMVD